MSGRSCCGGFGLAESCSGTCPVWGKREVHPDLTRPAGFTCGGHPGWGGELRCLGCWARRVAFRGMGCVSGDQVRKRYYWRSKVGSVRRRPRGVGRLSECHERGAACRPLTVPYTSLRWLPAMSAQLGGGGPVEQVLCVCLVRSCC